MLGFFNLRRLMTLLTAAILLITWPASSFAAPGSLPSKLLTLDGIHGSFSEGPYKDAIVVSSYSFEATVPDSQVGRAGKPEYHDVKITKEMDASSLSILKTLAVGQKIREGTLYFQNNNPKNNLTYLKIHFSDIRVTNYDMSYQESKVIENISLHFDQMLFEYTTQKPDGSPGNTDTLKISQGKITSIMTQYHFDPIYETSPKGISYIKGFKVSLKATADSGTVQQTQYRINGGSWATYTGTFEIYAGDTHSLEYFSTNKEGDVEAANIMNFDSGSFSGAGSY
ncbi:type VI secretion system tube protein Hcp [Paenibacillus sp. GCM10027628]|uniref:type VI secretion system tube protein Hcp n=1 Tax=Paenibacillus sp. GCM10027628 TaxID=3273413 RepID=UPI0036348BAC